MTVHEVPSASGPAERRPLSFLAASAWTLGSAVLLSLAVSVTDAARPGLSTDLVNLTACQLLVYSALVLAMVLLYEKDARLRDVLAVRAVDVLPTLLAAVAGASLYPALAALDRLVEHRFPLSSEELDQLTKVTAATTLSERVVLAVAVVVVGPLCETLFFQGLIYGGLRRGRVSMLAVIGTTAFFAMWRDPRMLALMLPLGFVLTWLRSRSGSVVPALVSGAAFFLVPVVPIVAGRGEVEQYPLTWIVGGTGLAVITTLVASLLFKRSDRALDARLADG